MLNNYAITTLVFFVKDLKRTNQFYSEVLGLTTNTSEGHEGSYITAQSGTLTLVFIPGEESPGQSPVIVFALDGGIDDLVESLVKQKVEIVVPVSEAPDGGLSADFLDPDGHILSLYQPADMPRRMETS